MYVSIPATTPKQLAPGLSKLTILLRPFPSVSQLGIERGSFPGGKRWSSFRTPYSPNQHRNREEDASEREVQSTIHGEKGSPRVEPEHLHHPSLFSSIQSLDRFLIDPPLLSPLIRLPLALIGLEGWALAGRLCGIWGRRPRSGLFCSSYASLVSPILCPVCNPTLNSLCLFL